MYVEVPPASADASLTLHEPKDGWISVLSRLGKKVREQDWIGLAFDAIELGANAIGPEPPALARRLVTLSVVNALHTLFEDHGKTLPPDRVAGFVACLENCSFTLNDEFINDPRELSILRSLEEQLRDWLELEVARGPSPAAVAAELSRHFVHALNKESTDNPKKYAPLFERHGRFEAAVRRERDWADYYDGFRRRHITSPCPVLGYARDALYVWPRGAQVEDRHRVRERVGYLREMLDLWVAGADPGDPIRVLVGCAGAGKSSFARMYADHLMVHRSKERTLYVDLQSAYAGLGLDGILAQLSQYSSAVKMEISLEGEPAELILIVDGLEVLTGLGTERSEAIIQLIDDIREKTRLRNDGGVHLRVLLCSRPNAIPRNYVSDRELLKLLPFVIAEGERRASSVVPGARHDILALDQRNEWWLRYKVAQVGVVETVCLPPTLADEALTPMTRLPLLLTLLAKLRFDEGEEILGLHSRTDLYHHLIEKIHERESGQRWGGQRPTQAQLGAVLETMALAAWHEGGRRSSHSAATQLPLLRGTRGRIEAYIEAYRSTGHPLIMFGEPDSGVLAFEFTHDDYVEYLVARRLVAQAWQLHGDGREAVEILVEWLEICGPRAITSDLLPYLKREFEDWHGRYPEAVRGCQESLVGLIEHVLEAGCPCEEVARSLRTAQAEAWARNTEEALLVLLRCCAGVTGVRSRPRWPRPTSFGAWIRRLRGQAATGKCPAGPVHPSVVGGCLGWLDLSSQQLAGLDLTYADLSHSCLRGAHLTMTILVHAELVNTELDDAYLVHANLAYANLSGASLTRANLTNADLTRADLRSARVDEANFTHANLRMASLDEQVQNPTLKYALRGRSCGQG